MKQNIFFTAVVLWALSNTFSAFCASDRELWDEYKLISGAQRESLVKVAKVLDTEVSRLDNHTGACLAIGIASGFMAYQAGVTIDSADMIPILRGLQVMSLSPFLLAGALDDASTLRQSTRGSLSWKNIKKICSQQPLFTAGVFGAGALRAYMAAQGPSHTPAFVVSGAAYYVANWGYQLGTYWRTHGAPATTIRAAAYSLSEAQDKLFNINTHLQEGEGMQGRGASLLSAAQNRDWDNQLGEGYIGHKNQDIAQDSLRMAQLEKDFTLYVDDLPSHIKKLQPFLNDILGEKESQEAFEHAEKFKADTWKYINKVKSHEAVWSRIDNYRIAKRRQTWLQLMRAWFR